MILLCATIAPAVVAQTVLWHVGFETRFENREGGDELTPDQTLFYIRVSPQLGITLPRDSRHALMAGATWFQPVNDNLGGYKILPTVYYRYRDKHQTLAIGYVDRDLTRELPRYLMSDSMRYCTPVVRGVLYRRHGDHGTLQAMLDWRQMQSANRREAFVVTASGYYRPGGLRSPLWLGGHVQYNHLAKSKNADDSQGVNDDAIINPMVRWTPSRHWSVEAGAIVSLQRARVDHKWHTPCRAVARGRFHNRRFDISEEVSGGKDLFPLYSRFGSLLNLGDPYYCYKFYSRTDAHVIIFNKHGIDLRAGVSLHATDKTFGWWQTIKASITLDGKFNKKSRVK